MTFWKATAILPCKHHKAELNWSPQGWRSKRGAGSLLLFPWRWEKPAGVGSCSVLQQGVRGWAPEGKPWKASQRVTWCKLLGKCCNCVTEMAEPQCFGKKVFPGEPVSVLCPSLVQDSSLGRPGIPQSECLGKGSRALFQGLRFASLWLRDITRQML